MNRTGRALVSGAALSLQMLGLAGVADGFVKWRAFFEEGVLVHYRDVVASVLGTSANGVTQVAVGYLISCVGFAFAALKTRDEHLAYLYELEQVPSDYHPIESFESPRGKARSQVAALEEGFSVFRLLLASLVWPLYLLRAVGHWASARPSTRKPAKATGAEPISSEDEYYFEYDKARSQEAGAFARWAGITVLASLGLLFLCADFLTL